LFVISAAALGSAASPVWKLKAIDEFPAGTIVVDVTIYLPLRHCSGTFFVKAAREDFAAARIDIAQPVVRVVNSPAGLR
jgi:hypothetical protein